MRIETDFTKHFHDFFGCYMAFMRGKEFNKIAVILRKMVKYHFWRKRGALLQDFLFLV